MSCSVLAVNIIVAVTGFLYPGTSHYGLGYWIPADIGGVLGLVLVDRGLAFLDRWLGGVLEYK